MCLIAPVIVSYPRGIVKSWLQTSPSFFDVLVAPFGAWPTPAHLTHTPCHGNFLVSYSAVSCASSPSKNLKIVSAACGIIHSKMAMVSVISTPILASHPNLVALNCPFTSWTLSALPPPVGHTLAGSLGLHLSNLTVVHRNFDHCLLT